MIRNPKSCLGVLVAVLALGAVLASAAQAAPEFSAKEYPAFVKGSHVGNVAFTEVGSISCEQGTYEGVLSKQSSTLTLEPKYSKCKDGAGKPVTWFWNGCDYLLHLKEKTGASNYKGNFDFACPAGKVIEAKGYTDGTHTTVFCRLTIGAQSGLLTVTYTNFKEGEQKKIETVFKVENVVFFQEGFGCANGKFEKGVLEGTVKLAAQDAEVNPIDLEIVGE
jgi:hypothetical protein